MNQMFDCHTNASEYEMSGLIHPCKSRTGLLSHLAVTLSSSSIMIALIRSVKEWDERTKKSNQGNEGSRHLAFFSFSWFSNRSRSGSQRKVLVYILPVLLPFLKAKQDGSRSKRCSPLCSDLGRDGGKKLLKEATLRAETKPLKFRGSSLQTHLADKDGHVLLFVRSVAQGQSQLLLAVDPTQLHLLDNTGTKHVVSDRSVS